MKVLVASDFYYEYELYKINESDLTDFVNSLTDLVNDKNTSFYKFKPVASQDSIDLESAKKQANKVIFTSDLVNE